MSHTRSKPPLGAVLQQAGLVSAEQIERAIEQQKKTHNSLRIGEILALQGRIDPQTASFFAERWQSAISEQPKQPIGQYLKQAGLLNEKQIEVILAEQKQIESKFGELAIAKGWLKQATLDFFLRYLYSESNPKSPKIGNELKSTTVKTTLESERSSWLEPQHAENQGKQDYSQKVHEGFLQIKRKLLKLEQEAGSEKILERVLSWTGGHSLLTQKIYALLAQSNTPISSAQEEEQVDYLVQTKIIDNWSNNELKSHLQGIEKRLIDNQQCSPEKLLLLYQKVLTDTVSLDNSREQLELLSLGLVVKHQGKLAVANRIYRSVFDLSWAIDTLNSQVRRQLDRYESLANRHGKSNFVVKSSTIDSHDRRLNFKNLLLLLTLLGLFGISINNISQRVTVRKSFRQGNELLRQKSFTEALNEYNRLLNIDSNYFQAWTNRGYALAGLQQYEQMRESCSTATIINPNAVYAWNCQGEALHNLKRYSEAGTAFDRAIALNQSDPIFLINKGESLRALGDNEGSVASLKQAVRVLEQMEAREGSNNIKGEFAVALTLLGNNYRQQSDYQKAIAQYERAIQYSPNYFPALVSKGITLSRAKRYSAAKSEFELILTNDSLTANQQAQTWFYLGKTYCQSAQYEDGRSAFERAIELNPDYNIAIDAKEQCR